MLNKADEANRSDESSEIGDLKLQGAATLAHTKAASWPLIASIGAIAISPLIVLTTAMGPLYNLWLAVMMVALWAVQHLTKREVGIAIGDPKSYSVALAYTVGIIVPIALGAWLRNGST